MFNDVYNELSQNFIEYAMAVNSDRSIPNANDGLKPVAKRIIYGAYDCGFKSSKPHVKCANLVGRVMADWHPHGDSSIYGALVRLSQPWVMRYPLIDFHGSNGNIDGDGPAASRYTECRLSKLAEDGMLQGIKKNNVDFMPNYSEDRDEPIELPTIFPNLLCNPTSGIGVAIASSWGCHNLGEVAQAIYDYIDGKEPMIYPDFPTGGLVINKDDVPNIMKTGHGSVKIRGKYQIEKNNVVFTELPYGIGTEALMAQIGELCDKEELVGIEDIRNESNKKGLRLVIECDAKVPTDLIIEQLFEKTNLQTSFSYNQVALVDKTPTELNLKDCIKIYIDYNTKCIIKEVEFDINKVKERLHIIEGLLKALDIIDEIIAMIKTSASAAAAKETLQSKWGFTEAQAKAILDMKLSKLAKLEKDALIQEQKDLNIELARLEDIKNNPVTELRVRLSDLVKKYGDARRTELTQITLKPKVKEVKEKPPVIPEKCVVVMTEAGQIKRIPATSFKTQRRNSKGVKTQEAITKEVIRTNTVDTLMIFSSYGKMYSLPVDQIPVGTNSSEGTYVRQLVQMEAGEKPVVIYSIYKDTEAKYVLYATKQGLIKKTALTEYSTTKRKAGTQVIKFNDGDELVAVSLIGEEDLIAVSRQGAAIKFPSTAVTTAGKAAKGVKSMSLKDGDSVLTVLPLRDKTDDLMIFSESGYGKRIASDSLPIQGRGGKGVAVSKEPIGAAAMINDLDSILLVGDKNNLCISGSDIPVVQTKTAQGNIMIKNNIVLGASKV